MEIKDKCPNCKKPNLINRPARNDIWCGWCNSEFMKIDGELVITLVKNDHLKPRSRNRKQYDRDYQKRRYKTAQDRQTLSPAANTT